MNEVREVMIEKSPNTTRLVDKLYEKGLILRERSTEDRRIVSICISDQGLQLLQDIDDSDMEKEVQFLNNIEENEAKQINEYLDKLRG